MRSCFQSFIHPGTFGIVRGALLIAALAWALAPCGCGGGKARTDEPMIVGSRGRDPGRFSFPRGIDVASDGRIAVADRTGRIQILSPDGKPLKQWFMPKFDNGTPTRLLFDSSDPATTTLLVVDTHNSRIMRYSLDGVLVQQFGKYGTNPDEMIFPTDIAVDASGTMYIAEYQDKHDRVMVYGRDGGYIRQFGDFGEEPGKFQRPEGIVFVPPGRLIVADTCNDRLQVFDLSGKLLEVWGSTGKAPGQFNYPYDLAVDKQGRIYVAEYGNNRIQVLDQTGRSVAVFGGPGPEPGQLGNPWGVALTAAGDKVWVADTLNHRLQKFDVKRTVQPLIAKQ
ncbi:6-bladed beta-propeller [bacterium]|nr:6-bladed beta-propeller [bacterium]